MLLSTVRNGRTVVAMLSSRPNAECIWDDELSQEFMNRFDRRTGALHNYKKLLPELRANVVRYLILPDSRKHEKHHPALGIRLPFISEPDKISALKSMSWMEVILEHGGEFTIHPCSKGGGIESTNAVLDPQDQKNPRMLCTILGALASAVPSRLPPDLHHHIENPMVRIHLSAKATRSDLCSPSRLRVIVPVDPRNTCEILNIFMLHCRGLGLIYKEIAVGTSLDKTEHASAVESLLFLFTILWPGTVSSRPVKFSPCHDPRQQQPLSAIIAVEDPLLKLDFMLKYGKPPDTILTQSHSLTAQTAEFAYDRALGHGEASYAVVRGVLLRSIRSPAYPSRHKTQCRWLNDLLHLAVLKSFNKWAHVEFAAGVTLQHAQRRHARLLSIMQHVLGSIGMNDQMQHDNHIECAKTGFIFHQLYSQMNIMPKSFSAWRKPSVT